MTERRGYAAALVTGLLGGVAVTVAAGRPWVGAEAAVTGLPAIEVTVDGATVAPLAGALGVVLLASFGAVIATRGRVRRAVGVVVVAAALAVIASALLPPDTTSAVEDALSAKGWTGGKYTTDVVPWRWLALVGAVGCLVAGGAVVARGHRWAVLGSRYDVPTSTDEQAAPRADEGELDDSEVWRAIDRGHDPTRER